MTSSADTPRPDLRLRALEPEDLELLYAIENDTSLWSVGTSSAYYSRYMLKQYIASASNDIFADGQLRLVAELHPADSAPKAIGLADLSDFDPTHLRAEVGMVLLPEYRHKGFSVAMLRLLTDHARRLRIHQLYATVAVTNAPAEAMLRNAGFTPTATLPDWLRAEEGFIAAHIWQKIL